MLRLPRKLQIIFRRVCRHVKMSGRATPATQDDITTCSERFCSFPHRHCDGTRKLATRDETWWSIKTSISCETSSNFTLRSFKIDVFQRVFLRIDLKIDVSCEASVNFHDMSQMPRLPRNWHLITTSRSADNAICKKQGTRHI